MPSLGLTNMQMGQIFSAFVLGYAIFQIPGGWLGDRWGARWILTLAIIWWSLFTALTALAPTLPLVEMIGIVGSLIFVRFLIGVGEAAALPNFNRAVANWLGPHERGLGIGITIGGIGIGSAMTPPITAWIMVNYGWQMAFYAAGALGLVIAAIWFGYVTDDPREHAHVNAAEVDHIQGFPASSSDHTQQKVPWRQILQTPTVWWLVLSYTCLGYVAYIYMSWFYLYLVNVRGFDILRGAFYAAGPFVAMMLFCPLGGWVTDRLARSMGINKGRRYVGASGMGLAALSIIFGSQNQEPMLALLFLSLGAGWLYFTVGAFWSSTVDLSKPFAGTLSGLMNTGANLGGTLSPTLTPWIADHFGWDVALGTAATLALLGALCWIKIRPGDGLQPRNR